LRKSKAGKHLFAFERDGVLGKGVDSLVLNVSDVKQLLNGETDWIKVSAMSKKEEEDSAEEK
jgi:hypothetical protein